MGHIEKGLKQKKNKWEKDIYKKETQIKWMTYTKIGYIRRRNTHGEKIYTKRK